MIEYKMYLLNTQVIKIMAKYRNLLAKYNYFFLYPSILNTENLIQTRAQNTSLNNYSSISSYLVDNKSVVIIKKIEISFRVETD